MAVLKFCSSLASSERSARRRDELFRDAGTRDAETRALLRFFSYDAASSSAHTRLLSSASRRVLVVRVHEQHVVVVVVVVVRVAVLLVILLVILPRESRVVLRGISLNLLKLFHYD